MSKLGIVFLSLLVALLPVPCMAVENIEFSYRYEIEKESIDFSDLDVCSEHLFFEQFAVNQKQWFAVYYRYSKTDSASGGTFERAYIDIYDDQGVLRKEISFSTTQDLAIELTENAVLIYLQTHVMEYTWEDNAICGYQIADYDTVRGELFNRLRQKEVVVGDWTYRSESAMHGCTKLVRKSAQTEQILVELPGSDFEVRNTVLSGLLIGAAMVIAAIGVLLVKHNKR